MPNPYYQPQSIAPILQEGLRARLPYLEQPKGAAAALPALGKVAETAFASDVDRSKKRSLMVQQQAYADYLAKVDAGMATEADHKTGMIAGLSLGLQPPDLLGKQLQRSQIAENEASAGLKSATADLYKRVPGATPGADGAGPEIINKDGRQFMVRRDLKGQVSYTPLQPTQEEKPIPAETAKTQNLARAGLSAISQIRQIINDPANKQRFLDPSTVAGGIGGEFLATVTGDTQAQILGQQIQEAGDALARLRTGAAITDTEEARYGNLLKGRFKTPEAYANALLTVETFLTNVERDLQTGRRRLGGGQAAAAPQQAAPAAQGGTSDDLLNKHGLP